MKKSVVIFLLWMFSLPVFAFSDKEIVIIRVEYAVKKLGIESRLYCDIGVANTHSLYRALTNEENTVQIKDENDKIRVFTTEVDLMNYLFTVGFRFDSSYSSEVINNKYQNFILIKD